MHLSLAHIMGLNTIYWSGTPLLMTSLHHCCFSLHWITHNFVLELISELQIPEVEYPHLPVWGLCPSLPKAKGAHCSGTRSPCHENREICEILWSKEVTAFGLSYHRLVCQAVAAPTFMIRLRCSSDWLKLVPISKMLIMPSSHRLIHVLYSSRSGSLSQNVLKTSQTVSWHTTGTKKVWCQYNRNASVAQVARLLLSQCCELVSTSTQKTATWHLHGVGESTEATETKMGSIIHTHITSLPE